jgi:hypothetical protein
MTGGAIHATKLAASLDDPDGADAADAEERVYSHKAVGGKSDCRHPSIVDGGTAGFAAMPCATLL